ncbi:MAG: nucleotidyl transferase AbiEii/AbiGii toxin family protein [Saprospiraceae bacterium]|nr:nucleotidyl transferase AbiEii/AbiGii toxin family protein [Saprospiraceae bacterium]
MLHLRTVEPRTLELLKQLQQEPLLSSHFLVGGTSLALQMGHRFSIDLDLFTHNSFEAEPLLEALKTRFKVQPLTVTNTIFITVVEGIKVDCVHFKYPFAFPLIYDDGVCMADARDIAPMKLDAVTKRGSKKDFYDMYYLFEQFSPVQILDWYTRMFQHSTSFHVIRSLTYFEDAEETEDPVVFDKKVTWPVVKERMTQVVRENF